MFKAFLSAAALSLPLSAAQACPMADNSFTVKINTHLRTKLYFNADCTQVVQNFRGTISKHDLTAKGRGWTFPAREPLYSWYVSPSGKSIRISGAEFSATGRMVKNRKKKP